jgi:hypothetical protein
MMKLRLTVVAAALSVLTVSPVFAGGADGGCAYGSGYKYTSVEPQEQSEAAGKLASLSVPAGEQDKVASTAAGAGADPAPGAENSSAQ